MNYVNSGMLEAECEETGLNSASESEKRALPANQRKHKCWSWAWNVFVHHGETGRNMDAGLGAELSDKFGNLSPEQREYYTELGKRAKASYKHGNKAFPAQQQRSRHH